jgi:hypothetical protein
VKVAIRPVDGGSAAWEGVLPHHDCTSQRHVCPLDLAPGSYVVTFESEATWNETPMGRALGFALYDIALEAS